MRVKTDAGKMLDRVLEVEFNIEKLHIGWSDVTAEECKCLQILLDERNKHQQEQQEEQQMEQQLKGLMNKSR